MSESDDDSGCDSDCDCEQKSSSNSNSKSEQKQKQKQEEKFNPRFDISKIAYTIYGLLSVGKYEDGNSMVLMEILERVLKIGTVEELEKTFDHHFSKNQFINKILQFNDLDCARLILTRDGLLPVVKELIKDSKYKFKLSLVDAPILILMINHCKSADDRAELFHLCWRAYYISADCTFKDLKDLLEAGKKAKHFVKWNSIVELMFGNLCKNNLPDRFSSSNKNNDDYYNNYNDYDRRDNGNDFDSFDSAVKSKKFKVLIKYSKDWYEHIGYPPLSSPKKWFMSRHAELNEMKQMSYADSWEPAPTGGDEKWKYPNPSPLEQTDSTLTALIKEIPWINNQMNKKNVHLCTKTHIRDNIENYQVVEDELARATPFSVRDFVRSAFLQGYTFELPALTQLTSTSKSKKSKSKDSSKINNDPRSCPQMLVAMNKYKFTDSKKTRPLVTSKFDKRDYTGMVEGLLFYELQKYPGHSIVSLSSLAVNETSRNGGTGKLLMVMFLLTMKKLGMQWVVIDAVSAAHNFYQRFGFQNYSCYSPLRKLVNTREYSHAYSHEDTVLAKKVDRICNMGDYSFVVHLPEISADDLLLHLTQENFSVPYSMEFKKRHYFDCTDNLSLSSSSTDGGGGGGSVTNSKTKLPEELKTTIKQHLTKYLTRATLQNLTSQLLPLSLENKQIFDSEEAMLNIVADNFHPSFLSIPKH